MAAPEIPEALTTWQAIGGIVVGIGWGAMWLLKFLAGRKEPVRSDMVIQEAYNTSSRPLEASAERCAVATEKTARLIELLMQERAADRVAHDRDAVQQRLDKADDDRRALLDMIAEIKKAIPPQRLDKADDEREHMREMMEEVLKRMPKG